MVFECMISDLVDKTLSMILNVFFSDSGCGRSVEGTLNSIRNGELKPQDLPPIQVSLLKTEKKNKKIKETIFNPNVMLSSSLMIF
mmetsp:Transcript_6716/g.9681  ORF Transcript_6716/g.9681 Transcript_6716/m.9681 type:complete len:85 (-) Transcript_6716:437-691(-)